jgi:type VI protein secretion system component Hcp
MRKNGFLNTYVGEVMATDIYLRTNGIKRKSENSAYIKKAKFEFTGTKGDDKQRQHVGTELKNLLISQVTPCIESASRLSENACLTFAKVKWRYGKQKISGGTGGQTLSGCGLLQSKIG